VNSTDTASLPPPLPGDSTGAVVFLWLLPVVAAVAVIWKLAELPLPACVFHGVTGLPCATCGMSRGFGLLLAGDVPGAAALNPLTILLPLVLFVAWLIVLMQRLGCLPRKWAGVQGRNSSTLLRVAMVLVVAAVWIYLVARRFG
jgi:hypothetical protein